MNSLRSEELRQVMKPYGELDPDLVLDLINWVAQLTKQQHDLYQEQLKEAVKEAYASGRGIVKCCPGMEKAIEELLHKYQEEDLLW